MLNQEIKTTSELLRPLLQQFTCGEYGLAIGGAHAKGRADGKSDLDLYVFATSVQPGDVRTRLTNQFSSDVSEVLSWGSVTPFEQSGTDFYLRELKIECWLRNSTSIERAIDECVAGIVKRDFVTWTTTGFYNHCVLSDLNTLIPLDDPVGMLVQWKERIRVYPPKLRTAIIAQHLAAARFWPWNFHYRSAVERQDVIYCTGIIQQVVHNLIQVIFAANEVYFSGDKKLFEALLHLRTTPDRFAERIQNLLFPAASVSGELLRSQQRELQGLVEDVASIVAQI